MPAILMYIFCMLFTIIMKTSYFQKCKNNLRTAVSCEYMSSCRDRVQEAEGINSVWQEHKKQRWRAKDEELKQTNESQILATHSFPFKEFEFQEF